MTAAIGAAVVIWAALAWANRDVGLAPPQSRLAQSGLLEAARAAKPGELIITAMGGTVASESLLRRIRAGEVAGVLLRGENIVSDTQVRRLTRSLQTAAAQSGTSLPLIVAVDQEGGTVRRFPNVPPSASARTMGTWTTERIRRAGRASGRALRSLGVNVDFAPVVDVPTSPSSFLGTRAFSTDRAVVRRAGCAFARGLADGGVIPTFKHFPGLGAAGSADTDREGVRISVSAARLRADARVFAACDVPGAATMVGHAIYPRLTGDTPAGMSTATYVFAARMGVTGPFVTDSLDAASVRDVRAAAVRSVVAGADLLVFSTPVRARRAYRELMSAHTRGVIDERMLAIRVSQVRALRRQILLIGP